MVSRLKQAGTGPGEETGELRSKVGVHGPGELPLATDLGVRDGDSCLPPPRGVQPPGRKWRLFRQRLGTFR